MNNPLGSVNSTCLLKTYLQKIVSPAFYPIGSFCINSLEPGRKVCLDHNAATLNLFVFQYFSYAKFDFEPVNFCIF